MIASCITLPALAHASNFYLQFKNFPKLRISALTTSVPSTDAELFGGEDDLVGIFFEDSPKIPTADI